MKRANTQEEKDAVTFTIIVDDEVAAYIEQEGIRNTNAYMNSLLQRAKQRQQAGKRPIQNLSSNTPDTSGYPEMKGHFGETAG